MKVRNNLQLLEKSKRSVKE